MKSKDIFWGVVLVGIGLMFLLRNFDVISFDWRMFRTLWPVLIILLGVALLPIHGLIRILLALIIMAGSVIFLSVQEPDSSSFFRFPEKFSWDWEDDENWGDENEWTDQSLYESFNPEILNAVLELDAIAGDFKITPTEDYLLKFEKVGTMGLYKLNTENAGSSVILRLRMEEGKVRRMNRSNTATIGLNTQPTWDIKMDAGAADIDFDLQPFKVDRVEVDGGAASIRIRLGDLNDNTNLRIDAGAASIEVEVPETSGCEIQTSTVLTSREFEGFIKGNNNHYKTANFEDATKKISIRIDAAVSSLKVVRY
ncbi:MAG: hypothetical protein IH598_08390 [Bacteroidales bacterium]|nr:hypothetical protein [Bacteroidales bacterium]